MNNTTKPLKSGTCPVCDRACFTITNLFVCTDSTCRAHFTKDSAKGIKTIVRFQGRDIRRVLSY